MRHYLNTIGCFFLIAATPVLAEEALDPKVAAYLAQNQRSLAVIPEGTWETGLSFSASTSSKDFIIGSTGQFGFVGQFSLTRGVAKGLEVSLQLPLSRSTMKTDLLGDVTHQSASSGAVGVSVRKVLLFESERVPEIVGTFGLTSPISGGAENAVNMGVDFYRQIDPMVVSMGISASKGLKTGDSSYDLHASMNFAVSDRVGLNALVTWAPGGGLFQDALKEDVSLQLGLPITSVSGADSFTPSIAFGLTGASANATMGFSWVRRW